MTPFTFIAQRVLQQLVLDEGSAFPLASAAILHNTYIDDVITGAKDVPSAIALRDQLSALMEKGGFVLRKWATNNSEVLAALPADCLETPLIADL